MVKNVEVKTQGIIARNEVQISRPGKSFCGKNNREGLEEVLSPKPLTITSFGCLSLKQKTEIFYREK